MDGLKRLMGSLFNFLEMPFFVVTYPDLRFFFSNRANDVMFFSVLLGREITDEELAGKFFDEVFLSSESNPAIRALLVRAAREKRAVILEELPVNDGQGGKRIFSLVCFPLTDGIGETAPGYIAGSVKDISHRYKTAEQETIIPKVKEALEYKGSLVSILNILPFGVIFYSKDQVVRYVNDSIFWLTGYEKEELTGLYRDQTEKILFRHNFNGVIGSEGITSSNPGIDTFIMTKFNQHRQVEVFHIPVLKMGIVDGTVTVIREKAAELELARFKEALRGVMDNITSVVVITDRDRNILACSKAGLEMCELEEEEVIGRPMEHVLNLLKVDAKELNCQAANGKKHFEKAQVSITTRSQKSRTLLFNNTPILSGSGEFRGLVSVGSDVTSFIEKQEKFIENERLAVIGQLTSSIAHEIKNPLTVISGFAEVTKSKILKIDGDDSLKESLLYYQQEIIDNSRNMNRLIVDLLQLARPKNAEKVMTNLSGTLDKICNTVAPYALQKNVTLIKNLMAADLEMAVDPVQIGQVLLNLCNNAIQAMESGGTLGISTELGGGYLIIQVSDTGCGIREEDLGKLGTPFFTTKAEGTGLGLSVTYSIVRDYGGKIEVESRVGKGSTFKVYLPAEK